MGLLVLLLCCLVFLALDIDACLLSLVGSTGSLSISTNASRCEIHVVVENGSLISFRIGYLKCVQNCTVQMYAGKSMPSNLIGHHSIIEGRENITDLVGSDKAVFLFQNDLQENVDIILNYKQIECNHTYFGPSGLLTSPNYPGPYPRDLSCTFRIEVPPDKGINLTFSAFNVGTDEDGHACIGDFVEVSDGGIHCGFATDAENIIIHKPVLTISLVTKETGQHQNYTGFRAYYNEIALPGKTQRSQEEYLGYIHKEPQVVYKISVATTVVLGVVIGVLVFIVVVLSSLLVRQRSTKYRRDGSNIENGHAIKDIREKHKGKAINERYNNNCTSAVSDTPRKRGSKYRQKSCKARKMFTERRLSEEESEEVKQETVENVNENPESDERVENNDIDRTDS